MSRGDISSASVPCCLGDEVFRVQGLGCKVEGFGPSP